MKSGDWKMTVETLAAGQRGAYQDTVHTYRVFFSRLPYKPQEGAGGTKFWEPMPQAENEAFVRRYLKAIYGWLEADDEKGNAFSPRLDFMKKVGPGTWEFSVREQYTG